ncbi:MAG: glycogen debranching enzyme N-terminal domain-containing protein [Gemmatimonadaceae bacterium]
MRVLEALAIRYGLSVCGDPVQAAFLEWLVTNSIGGYASGIASGIRTRRYHGLLVAGHRPTGRPNRHCGRTA